MNKFCPNCGKEVAEGVQFCGAPVNATQQAAPQVQVQNGQPVQPMQQVPAGTQQKSKLCAGLLGIFLGTFGVHNFYLGYTGKAVGQLLITLLSCFILSPIYAIWGLVEGILILCGNIDKDASGKKLVD